MVAGGPSPRRTSPADTGLVVLAIRKEQIVELVRAGRSPGSLAREFEPSEQTIRNWVKRADMDEGRRSDGLTTEARLELLRLKREVKRLRMERDILKKAAAWFARESDTIPSGGTRS